jgi:hypothetical protein
MPMTIAPMMPTPLISTSVVTALANANVGNWFHRRAAELGKGRRYAT